jgi:hypothetical protein
MLLSAEHRKELVRCCWNKHQLGRSAMCSVAVRVAQGRNNPSSSVGGTCSVPIFIGTDYSGTITAAADGSSNVIACDGQSLLQCRPCRSSTTGSAQGVTSCQSGYRICSCSGPIRGVNECGFMLDGSNSTNTDSRSSSSSVSVVPTSPPSPNYSMLAKHVPRMLTDSLHLISIGSVLSLYWLYCLLM